MSKEAKKKLAILSPFVIGVGILIFLFVGLTLNTSEAEAVSCFASDGDGVYDTDGDGGNGVIKITGVHTIPAAASAYDCSSLDFWIVANGVLFLDGNEATGEYAAVNFKSLDIDTAGSVHSDEGGCTNPGNANGYGPNGSNVCTISTAGYGRGNFNNNRACGGAGYGGDGGAPNTGTLLPGEFYSTSLTPLLFGSSGGSAGYLAAMGGTGGGIVRINVTNTLINDGIVSANGGDGGWITSDDTDRAPGGGSGGSVYVTAGRIDGSGSFQAHGGGGEDDPAYDGGGGAGGRIYITHDSNDSTFSFSGTSVVANGGLGPDDATDGAKGTAYVKNTAAGEVKIFQGFTIDDTDFSETTWIFDASALNLYCNSSAVSPSFTATYLTLNGQLTCDDVDATSLTSMAFSASNTLTLQSGMNWHITKLNADVDFTVPNNQTWTNVTLETPAEGLLTIDDSVSINLAGTTAVNANAQWTNLTDLTVGSSAMLSANKKGCYNALNATGFGPNASNVCSQGTAGGGIGNNADNMGLGGGGHGGAGGDGTTRAGGTTYNDPDNPVLFGSTGGSAAELKARGGNGGGYLKLNVSGTLDHQGVISASGENGTTWAIERAAGGGSGGSINITTGTYNCSGSGSFSVAGGDGGNMSVQDGGGGGGGMLKISASTDDSTGCPISGLTAASVAPGGAADGSAVAGSTGTLSTGAPAGVAPTVDTVRVAYSANGSNVSPLVLSPGANKSMHVNGVVSDGDGYTDIQNVSTVLYRSGVSGGVGCAPDKNDCYSVASCNLTGGGGNSINYDCDISMAYFADATDSGTYYGDTWNARVTVQDATNTVNNDSYTNEVQTLLALGTPGTVLDFGTLDLGTTSPSSETMLMTNHGNVAVDANISMASNMACTSGSIPLTNIKYGRTDTAHASLEYTMSSTPAKAVLSLPRQINDFAPSTDTLYWRHSIPGSGVGGVCTGTITISATTP
ncbi:MAG: hypothetical protein ABIA47_00785 [bacterium]